MLSEVESFPPWITRTASTQNAHVRLHSSGSFGEINRASENVQL